MDQEQWERRTQKTNRIVMIVVALVWGIALFRVVDPLNVNWTKTSIVILCLIGTLFQVLAQQRPILRHTYKRDTWLPMWELKQGLSASDVIVNATSMSASWACFGAAFALLVEHY